MAVGAGPGRAQAAVDPDEALARMLLRRGLVQPVQVDLARERRSALPLAARLLAVGALDDAALAGAIAEHHGLLVLTRDELRTAPTRAAVPLAAPTVPGTSVARGVLQPGPADLAAPAGVGIALLRDLQARVGAATDGVLADGADDGAADGADDGADPGADSGDAVQRALATVLRRARRDGVDVVVMEPVGERLRIRMRTDDELADVLDLPAAIEPALAAALKRAAHLDVLSRAPQDALVRLRLGDPGTEAASLVHVATTPVATGERLVVRLVG